MKHIFSGIFLLKNIFGNWHWCSIEATEIHGCNVVCHLMSLYNAITNMASFGLKALKNAKYFMYKNVGTKKLWNESLSIESRDDLRIAATNSRVNSMKFSCWRCCGDSSREVILCKYSSHFNRHSIYAFIRSFITYAENSSNFCLKAVTFEYDTCTFYLNAINIDQFRSSILQQQQQQQRNNNDRCVSAFNVEHVEKSPSKIESIQRSSTKRLHIENGLLASQLCMKLNECECEQIKKTCTMK